MFQIPMDSLKRIFYFLLIASIFPSAIKAADIQRVDTIRLDEVIVTGSMPKVNLDASFVRTVASPDGRKIDYYDNAITGFILEVRSTGGKTYHLRYRDSHGKQCQHKIGDAKSITFEKARTAAGSGLFYCIFCCFVLLLS